MARNDQKRATAYHEAGHAVIGRVLGMTCGGATILPDYDEGIAGHSISRDERSIADWECRGRSRWVSMFRARIMMLMAGRESEIECFGRGETAVFGDGNDLREIYLTISEADVPDEAFLARLRVKTRGLVRRHRRAITQVAAALMKHGSLDEQQIDAIVTASGVRLVERVDPQSVTFEEQDARARAWAT
jgi:ATP-dependent Zn protease